MIGIIDSGQKLITNNLFISYDISQVNSYQNGSTNLIDLSGNSNNGILFGSPILNTLNGGSLVFDGIDDRIYRTSSANTGQDFTISAWIYPTTFSVRNCISSSSYNYQTRSGWLLSLGGGGNVGSFFLSIGRDNAYRTTTPNSIVLNQWVFITAVCSNGGGLIRLFKNGSEVSYSSIVENVGTITYNYPQFNVGIRDINGTFDRFIGRLSQIQIYNRSLSLLEIQQNYNVTKSRYDL